jgi:hypothetical protein
MILFFIILFLLFVASWFFYRDRRYLKKKLREVISEDMKPLLNIPTEENGFSEQLTQKQKDKKASRKILEDMNS